MITDTSPGTDVDAATARLDNRLDIEKPFTVSFPLTRLARCCWVQVTGLTQRSRCGCPDDSRQKHDAEDQRKGIGVTDAL